MSFKKERMKTNNKAKESKTVYHFFGSKLVITLIVFATLFWLYIGYVK